jgi:hypothetical protein
VCDEAAKSDDEAVAAEPRPRAVLASVLSEVLNPCIDARVAADGTEEMDRSAVPSDAVVTDMVLSALANPSSLGGLRRRHT